MNKFLTILSLFVISLQIGTAQTKKAFLESADIAFAEKDFYSALVYYRNVLEFDTTNLQIQYQVAESARNFMSYDIAEKHYQFVSDNLSDNEYPDVTYKLAQVKQMQAKYQEAMDLYDLYLTENSGDDPYLTARADKERAACEWAFNEISNPDETIIVANMGASINTTYSDFGPAMDGEKLYYSSMRFDGKDKYADKLTKLLVAENEENGTLLDASINESELHVANAAFNTDKSKVFYTICERLNDSELRCDLYCRMRNEDGTFGASKKLPDFINNDTLTTTHPTVGYDATIDKEVLYFVSDRDGGKGKLDIWYSIIDNKDNFTAPRNLEKLNTPEDDLTPFFHLPSKTLYFSSNGYRSFGGYDVYQSKLTSKGFVEAKHLNNPLNSSYHDLYFVLNDAGDKGYFATNREGTQYIDDDQKACCFDLYKVDFLPLDLDLNAITLDRFSQDSIPNATVRLIDEDTGELIEEITNIDGADHIFKLDRCRNYLIIGEKVGYKSDTIKLSSCDFKKSQEIIKKLFLEPQDLDLEILTFFKQDNTPLEGCTVTLYDLTDNSVAEVELTNASSNDFSFPLIRGHEYRVVAKKFGFTQAEAQFNTDKIAGIKLVKKMFLDRDFEARLTAFLPLNLYFDNDRPDARTRKRTTKKTYTETYQRYIARQDYFANNSANPEGITEFFEYDVKTGYEQFKLFLGQLEKALNEGETYELSIRGFASPRAQSNYNLILGQRRVFSIRNEIELFNGGALLPFIQKGQLILTDVSYGETLAPSNVSDSDKNRKLSVYSVEASKERRVEIIDVTQQEEE